MNGHCVLLFCVWIKSKMSAFIVTQLIKNNKFPISEQIGHFTVSTARGNLLKMVKLYGLLLTEVIHLRNGFSDCPVMELKIYFYGTTNPIQVQNIDLLSMPIKKRVLKFSALWLI